ncbi:MAG: hypothetical protein SCM96_02595 [Acidobacteriota bacterium]|nr:hypothetical protein [Acidobacteriota bacterium]
MIRKPFLSLTVSAAAVIILSAGSAFADRGDFGVGIILGEPTGITIKQWTGRTTAIDAAAAWSLERDGAFHVHADYLIHSFRVFSPRRGSLPVYYGIGGRILSQKKNRAGIRFPVGLAYLFDKTPLELFFEIGPVLDLIPSTDISIGAGLGVRYYFR